MDDVTRQPVAYVADAPIPPAPPPANTVGAVGWIRANLFPDVLNSVLTILAIAFLVSFVPGWLDWAYFHSVWTAESLAECRAIMDEAYGEGVRGACWAVVNERFSQFVYGYYPAELRWRPNLVFVLLLVALAPVLFQNLPGRRLFLLVTLAFPALAYYLIWGGSMWPFFSLLAGGVLTAAAFSMISKINHPVFGTPGIAALGAIAVASLYLNYAWTPFGDFLRAGYGEIAFETVESDSLGGFLLTMVIGVTAIAVSLPIGVLLALGRQSSLIFIRSVAVGFIECVRGVPLITLLFVASTVLNYFLPPGTTFDIILRVVIVATLFASAYIAEAVRGALASLPKGQYEAADALGLTYWQSMRMIILPQALKVSIPSIVNIFIGLFKDTTLVSVIGLSDPLGIIQPILGDSSWQGIIAELYVFVALVFFFLCFGMSRYSMYLERRLQTDHR
ncbi:MAG: amino acid ABC transporter permease [Paracoccaceae bacterium]